MKDFFINNASAIFALLGAILGTIITSMFSFFSKSKETKLRLTELLINKKIIACESLMKFSGLIRTMTLLGGEDEDGELRRCPEVISNKKNINAILEGINELQNNQGHWLFEEVNKELYLLIEYLINLREWSRASEDIALEAVAIYVRSDIIEFGNSIESTTCEFYNKDMLKLNYMVNVSDTKFSDEVTLRKLGKKKLFKNKNRVLEILGFDNPTNITNLEG